MKNVLLALALLAGSASGQTIYLHCNDIVADGAQVLGSHVGDVQAAAEALNHEGADVRVVALADLRGQTLDAWEKDIEGTCPSWRAPDGNRKSTLLVLAAAPNDHKMGVYYGSAWHKALDDHWNRIKQEQMGPRFHDHDFAGGMVAGLNAFTRRIQAAQTEAIQPKQTVVNEQATDFSGFWTFLYWLLALGSVGGVIAALYYVLSSRTRRSGERRYEQQQALFARNEVVRLLRTTDVASLPPVRQADFNVISEQYSRVSQSAQSDPDDTTMTVEQYRAVRAQYENMSSSLRHAITGNQAEQPRAAATAVGYKSAPKPPHAPKKHDEPRPAAETERERRTNVNFSPIIIGNDFGESHESSPSHSSWSAPDPSPSSDTGGGGSSDFGSSWGGGGGSSDFGGGGDSGGGGSSDF